jgi:hypothetical protein
MISIFTDKFSIHITLTRFHKHIRWIDRGMHNLATGVIIIKMSGILALRAIQATFFNESGLFVNESTSILLGNISKTLMLESEPLTLISCYRCFYPYDNLQVPWYDNPRYFSIHDFQQ